MKFKSPTLAITALATAMLAAPINVASATPAGMTSALTGILNGIGSSTDVVDVQTAARRSGPCGIVRAGTIGVATVVRATGVRVTGVTPMAGGSRLPRSVHLPPEQQPTPLACRRNTTDGAMTAIAATTMRPTPSSPTTGPASGATRRMTATDCLAVAQGSPPELFRRASFWSMA
jgi:hypothetical protein